MLLRKVGLAKYVTGNLNLLRKIDGTTMFGLVILSNHSNRSAMRPVSVGIGFM